MYVVPFEEVDLFRRHTRSYIKKLRQASKKVASYTKDSILVENLEELVDLSIQEIVQPLDQLDLESPVVSVLSQSPPQIMAGNVNQPAWRAKTPLNMVAPLHDLPKQP